MPFLRAWPVIILFISSAAWLHAEDGIVWKVQGDWRISNTQDSLRKGEPVAPGALLTASTSTTATVLILLPDGQRLLFDCHDVRTCTQGFRVPALMEKPDDDAVQLFHTVRDAMRLPAAHVAAPSTTTTETETVIPLEDDGTILLRRALAALPPGQYRLTVQGAEDAQPSDQSLTWSGPRDDARLPLFHAGVYHLRLFGNLGVERMRVVLLAESPQLFSSRQKAFAEARKDLQEWNETFPGWPIHEWLQLYLEGLAHPQQ